jgi:hypothetical protein
MTPGGFAGVTTTSTIGIGGVGGVAGTTTPRTTSLGIAP